MSVAKIAITMEEALVEQVDRKILGQKGSTSEAGKGLFVNVNVKVNVKVVSLS